MTRPHSTWSDADTENLFTFIGRYVVYFELVEAKLDEIILFVNGHKNWASTQAKLAKMTNDMKIKRVNSAVVESFERLHVEANWLEHFRQLIDRLGAERRRRNAIVHSQYLFEFIEAGMPPVRSHRKSQAGKGQFDQEQFSFERSNEVLREIAGIYLDLSQVHLQIVHSHRSASAC